MQIKGSFTSDHKFHSLIKNSSELIAVVDPKGNYLYVSPSGLDYLGIDLKDIYGKNAFEFIHPEDAEQLYAILQNIDEITDIDLPHYRILKGQNQYRWIESRLSNQLNDPEINGIIVNSKDITEKKLAEEEIHRLSLIARETTNGVTITDKDGKVVWVNKSFTEITGYTLDDIKGKYPGDVLRGPQSSQQVANYIFNQTRARLPFECEIINYTKSGETIWMKIQGQPIFDSKGKLYQYFALQSDITKEKEIAELAKFHERKLDVLIQNSFDVVQVMDVNGRITYSSPAVESVMGYKPDELLNESGMSFVHPEDIDHANSIFDCFLNSPGQSGELILRLRNKQGEYRICDIHAKNLVSDKYVNGIIINYRDITDKVHLEELLFKEKLAAQKLITRTSIKVQESERELIGRELHDNVNQILTCAKLYLDLAENAPTPINDYIKQSREFLMTAIQEIRNISKALIPPSLNETSLEQSLNSLLDTLETLKGIRCYTRYAFDETKLEDAVKFTIYRVVQEQITNIIKYSQASEMFLSLIDKDGRLVLIISDNGVGFDSTEKRNGIGLKNMAERIKSIDGNFQLITEPGAGCKIVITI
jgi:PAS domain S-box-containing protein